MPRPKGSSNMALHNLTTDDGSKPRGKMTAYAFFVQVISVPTTVKLGYNELISFIIAVNTL